LVTRDWVSKRDRLKKRIRAIQVIIDDDVIMSPGKLCIVNLKKGGFEALLDRGCGFGPATDETIAQGGQGWWSNETVDRVQVGIFNLTDALRKNEETISAETNEKNVPGLRCREYNVYPIPQWCRWPVC
jgi:hypothetical protein